MDRLEIAAKLAAMGVPGPILQDLPGLPADTIGLMVYGSRARGDYLPDSDLDLLALVPQQIPSIAAGAVSVSFYSAEQLATGISTLFGAHLKRDGRLLFDTDGRLRGAIEIMGEVDTELVLARVRAMSMLFTEDGHDLPKYLPGLLREARYLLRSALYAQAIAEGKPCFSVRELAVRYQDDSLARLLASRHDEEPSMLDYDGCRVRLLELLGGFPVNKHGSLEACVVNEWGTDSDLLSMAVMALGSTGGGSDYAEVRKLLL